MKVWYRVVDYIHDPKTHADAIKIMSSRVGITPAEYESFVNGTKILTLEEAKKFYKKGPGFDSIYGSTQIVDKFNVDNKVYATAQPIDEYIDPSIVTGL